MGVVICNGKDGKATLVGIRTDYRNRKECDGPSVFTDVSQLGEWVYNNRKDAIGVWMNVK